MVEHKCLLIWKDEICFNLAGKTISHSAGEYSPNLMMMMIGIVCDKIINLSLFLDFGLTPSL